MKKRYEDNMPGFARGELSAEEQAWMESYLSTHPDEREDAMFMKSSFNAFKQMAANIQDDPNEGLDELLGRINRDEAMVGKRRALMNRIWERLQGIGNRIPIGVQPTFSVHFSPMASEAEIRSLLQQMNGRIVNGPDAEAYYSVKVRGGESQDLLDQFLQSPIVDSANLRSRKK